MNILPLHTLPLRLRLRIARRRNATSRNKLRSLDQKYSRWARAKPAPHSNSFLVAQIHPYPGLGHQLASWVAGYLWARDLDLDYDGGALTRDDRGLFSFQTVGGNGPGIKGVKVVRLISVGDERDPRNLTILRGQVQQALKRWPGVTIRFQLSLDQFRWDQTPAEEVVRSAILRGAYGEALRDLESAANPYIALHIRRGDVSRGTMGGSTSHSRWVDEGWYVEMVRNLRKLPELAGLEVRAYALGQPDDFPALQREGISLRLNGDRDLDFIELCAARVLVTAPSSFSFTAGLASRGAVIAQFPWWHRVPEEGRWVRADQHGNVSGSDLMRALGYERAA
jgi:hypothetical protein